MSYLRGLFPNIQLSKALLVIALLKTIVFIASCFAFLSNQAHAQNSPNEKSLIVVGAQFGDEGKGKVIDYLSQQSDIIVRSQGGNNAGHTVIVGDNELKLHLIPSGILSPKCQCYIGGGVVLDPKVALEEMKSLNDKNITLQGRLWISPYTNLILPYHKLLDQLSEKSKGKEAIGTTGRGIGPAYADRTNRIGIRMADFIDPAIFKSLLERNVANVNQQLKNIYKEPELNADAIYKEYSEYAKALAPYVKEDLEIALAQDMKNGKSVLFEGAQGTFLDNIFGTFPFVTSSNTIAAGICTGGGVGPSHISHTLGVLKAYTTRVGNGPMPTEVADENSFLDAKAAREYGTTTGRKRRVGWFDAVLAKHSAGINGIDSIALMKLDILDTVPKIKVCTAYKYKGKNYDHIPGLCTNFDEITPVYEELDGWMKPTVNIRNYDDLPEQAKRYVQRISELVGVKIYMISVGPERSQTILIEKNSPFGG